MPNEYSNLPALVVQNPQRRTVIYKPLPTPLPAFVNHDVEKAEESLLLRLTEMAICRGAQPDSRYIELLARRLARVPLLDSTLHAIHVLSERQVREGEVRLPDLGTILANRPLREEYSDHELAEMRGNP